MQNFDSIHFDKLITYIYAVKYRKEKGILTNLSVLNVNLIKPYTYTIIVLKMASRM